MEKRDFPLRVSELGGFRPRDRNCSIRDKLVLYDPEPERILWSARRALQFRTAGTSAIAPVVHVEEEPKALPFNNPLFESTRPMSAQLIAMNNYTWEGQRATQMTAGVHNIDPISAMEARLISVIEQKIGNLAGTH
ncbi:hypothetical protein M9H77_02321 [Catharanthus roseus]|uniref:Uncharacterized protein n=1 Tax=Catharanthus roseus TaxID=4058 RepID=A0ACC0C814_CATRO|nr:hypothetical protein M9H77_02321 [Catharanthus roseus]